MTYIIDFDSTFIQVETFDILAQLALNQHPEKAERLKLIHAITEEAMAGKIAFDDALRERFRLLSLTQHHIEQAIFQLKKKITPSFLRNKAFFSQHKENIIIISGSFVDIVWPVVKSFDILRKNVFANRLLYDGEGTIYGYDEHYPLAQNQGKVKLVQSLKLQDDVIVIGDGYNDYEIKEAQLASTFIALTENITRESVVALADSVIDSLEGLFITLDLPLPTQERKNVLLLENIHPNVESYLTELGYRVTTMNNALSGKALIDALDDIHYLGIRSKTAVTQDILQACPQLEAIGAFCIGTNQIDISQCNQQGVAVFNAPFSNTRSVVELALADIIMLVRQAAKANTLLMKGQWQKSSSGAHEVRGKTLGIIGYGNIGSQLSIVAEALGMHVIFYDIANKLPLGNTKMCESLDEVFEQADVISLHVDGRPENRHFIDATEFAKMKKGALFLNLSRDFVVNYDAMVNAFESGHLAGVAVDVFPNEPQESKCAFKTPLQKFDNVILTPHIGGSTEEAQAHIGDYVSKNLHAYSTEGATAGSVNLPTLTLPPLNYPQRVIHLHDNVPGILAQINQLFAEHNCNIEGQFLKTNETLGYVITDLNHVLHNDIIDKLSAIKHTIKIRSLVL